MPGRKTDIEVAYVQEHPIIKYPPFYICLRLKTSELYMKNCRRILIYGTHGFSQNGLFQRKSTPPRQKAQFFDPPPRST